MKMTQDELLHRFLLEVGTITPVEASTVYKIRSLTSCIARLRRRGMRIVSERKTDLAGQRYVRYHCLDSKNCDPKFLGNLDD